MRRKEGLDNIKMEEQVESSDEISNTGCLRWLKDIKKKFLQSWASAELDVFATPIKFLIKGQSDFQTVFSGLMGLLVLLACSLISYGYFFYPGVDLNSNIKLILGTPKMSDPVSIFQYSDNLLWFDLYQKSTTQNSKTLLDPMWFSNFTFSFVQNCSNISTPLIIDTVDCPDSAQFCVKKNAINQKIMFPTHFDSCSLRLTIYSCASTTPDCFYNLLYTRMIVGRFRLNRISYVRGGGYVLTNMSKFINLAHIYAVSSSYFIAKIYSASFQSNNKLFGSLNNFFSYTNYYMEIGQLVRRDDLRVENALKSSLLLYDKRLMFVADFLPSQLSHEVTEEFFNLTGFLVFFLSIRETLYFIIAILFLRQYNRNCAYLWISSRLYYMMDPKTGKPYNFEEKGLRTLATWFACLTFQHPILKTLDYISKKLFRRSLNSFMGHYILSIYAMIARAQDLMIQDSFYQNIAALSTLEDGPVKKLALEVEESEEEDPVEQLDYFSNQPEKKNAFADFCLANGFLSAERKNHIYQLLLEKTCRSTLIDQLKKEFKKFEETIFNVQNESKRALEVYDDELLPVSRCQLENPNPHIHHRTYSEDAPESENPSNILLNRPPSLKNGLEPNNQQFDPSSLTDKDPNQFLSHPHETSPRLKQQD